MEKNQENRYLGHILISGGSRGLGLATVDSLLEKGYRVSTFSRSSTPAIEERLELHPSALYFEEVNLRDAKKLREFVRRATKKFGPLYGLINNSAIAVDGVLATLPEVEIENMIDVNLSGSIRLTRLCLRDMLVHKEGKRIINISSIVGLRGYNGLCVYASTKGGLDAFSRALAREVGRRQITVNSIAPGYMRTAMSSGLRDEKMDRIVRRTPLGRLAELDDVVPLILFILSDEARFITGQTFVIDGGITC